MSDEARLRARVAADSALRMTTLHELDRKHIANAIEAYVEERLRQPIAIEDRELAITQLTDINAALRARVRELEAHLDATTAAMLSAIPTARATERRRIVAKLREIRTGRDGWREDALRSFADELERDSDG